MKDAFTTMIQLETLKSEGLKNTQIAKRLNIHRETVAKYLKLLEESRITGVPIGELLPKKGGHRPRLIEPYMDHIQKRLADFPELTAKRIYKEIKKKGYTGSQRTVRRYVSQVKLSFPARTYKPYETEMGEQAQVDWGYEWLQLGDKKLKVYSFCFLLSHSRIRYVEYVLSLDGVVFLNCLHRAFEYIGGVPKTVLFDNAKTVVSERVGNTIRFQADLLQYAVAVGFEPRACWIADPESKGKVESTVKYVHQDFFYGEEFTSFEDLNARALEWCNEVNREVHSTIQAIPHDVWKQEKGTLKALPKDKPAIFRIVQAKVNKACLFSFGGNQYSVPHVHARGKVRLEIYEHEFKVYAGEKEIGRWPRTTETGKRYLHDEHYANRHRGTKKHTLEQTFKQLNDCSSEYLIGLIEHRGASLKEQMEKILALVAEYTMEEIQWSMNRAIEFGNYGYDSLKRMLIKHREAPESLPTPARETTIFESTLAVEVETRDLSYYEMKGGNPSWNHSMMASSGSN